MIAKKGRNKITRCRTLKLGTTIIIIVIKLN